MRIARSLLMVGIVGCYAPTVPVGVPCTPGESPDNCPSGQQCIVSAGAGRCELPGAAMIDATVDSAGSATPDAGPTGGFDGGPDGGSPDRDHDGVADSVDNCPDVANSDQADEDGDHLGNVCDPCPPFSATTDSDGDGLPDACDPNPSVTGDRLVMFEGFTSPLSAGWTHVGTFSTQAGDGIANAPDGTSTVLSIASPAAARVEIRAAVVLETITSTGLNLGGIGLIDRFQPGTDKAVTCQLVALTGATQPELRIFDTGTSTIIASAAHPATFGSELELRLRRNVTSYACRATNPTLDLTGTDTFSPASPRIGLRMRNANGRIHWLMIVTSP